MIRNINFFLLCFFCIAGITPIINSNLHPYVLIGIFLMWFCTAAIGRGFESSKITKFALGGLAICWLYKIVGISSASIGNYMNISYFYAMPICMLYVQKNYSSRQKWILSGLIIVVYIINIASNILLFDNLSNYTQWSFNAAVKDEEMAKSYNLGDTSFTVGTMVLTGVLTILTLMSHNKSRLLFAVGLAITLYYNFVCAGRASVILLIMVLIASLYLVYRTGGFILQRALAILLPTIVVFLLFGSNFFHYLGDVFPNERLAVRMHALGVLFEGGDISNEDTLERGSVSMLSINTWLRNIVTFFFGIGDHRYEAGNIAQVYSIGIGGHSSFFDTLARYGLLGFSLWIGLIINICRYIRYVVSDRKLGDLLFVACIIAFARSFTGGVFHAPFAITTYILLPCSITLLLKKEEIW